jgi:hypothetical protein
MSPTLFVFVSMKVFQNFIIIPVTMASWLIVVSVTMRQHALAQVLDWKEEAS